MSRRRQMAVAALAGLVLMAIPELSLGQEDDPFDLEVPELDDGILEDPGAPQNRPAEKSDSDDRFRSPEMIARLVQYYLDMYNKELESGYWMRRVMGVISLARIDDPKTTARIFQVMAEDENTVVQVYAWEALHARLNRLDEAQRAAWMAKAMELNRQKALQGDLRLGLIGALQEAGPNEQTRKHVRQIFATTNSRDPWDIRTLWALGDLLKAWQDRQAVLEIIATMKHLDAAWRAELVLRRITRQVPHSRSLARKGSAEMWKTTRQRWADWAQRANWKPTEAPAAYMGRSGLLPAGLGIANTRDEKWRKDLELPKFSLAPLDVALAVDSTGSMGKLVKWVKRDVSKALRALSLVSAEPRISVCLFRDRGDEYIVKPTRLRSSGEALAAALQKAEAKGGADVPEAVYEALWVLINKLDWSQHPSARKIIILLGDAPPKEKDQEKLLKTVRKAADEGFRFFAIKIRTEYTSMLAKSNYDPMLETFDAIAEAGNGRSMWVDFTRGERVGRTAVASPPEKGAPDEMLLREILKASVVKGYESRVDPFVNVLMNYVNRSVPEKREAFEPVKPKPPKAHEPAEHRERKPRKPKKPKDPQAR